MLFSKTSVPSMTKDELLQTLSAMQEIPLKKNAALTDYAALADHVTLDNGSRVTVWDRAIRQALKEHNALHFPAAEEPYYIFRSIILKSGQQLSADASAHIKALPGLNVAMVRNASIVPGNQLPEPENVQPDHNIRISGGTWDYGRSEYADAGRAEESGQITGGHGTFLFSNVHGLTISDLEIRNSPCFCIQISNAENIRVNRIVLRDSYSDGLHLNGPLRNVYIQDLHSEGTGDDILSLNAWDWSCSHVTAGPIENLAADTVTCSRGYSCMRLLPGIKRYYDGTSRDCFIRNAAMQNLENIQNFKIYAQGQPLWEYVSELGHAENLYFTGISGLTKMNRISFQKPYYGQRDRAACFEILADVTNIVFDDLNGDFDFPEDPAIIAVGPISMTVPCGGKDPFFAKEFFPVNQSCVVRNMTLGKVTGKNGTVPLNRSTLVKISQLSVKPDFVPGRDPARGGTGTGKIEGLKI